MLVGSGIGFVADRFGNAARAVSFGSSGAWIEIPEAQFAGITRATISLNFYATSSARQVLISKMSYAEPISSSNFYQSFVLVMEQYSYQPIEFGLHKEGFCGNAYEGWNPTLYSNTGFNLNEWNHIAVTFNNNIERMYLNGNLVGQQFITPSPICAGEPIRLGVWWQDGPLYFTGSMDEVMILDRVLSQREIRRLAVR